MFKLQGHNSPFHIRYFLHTVKFCSWNRGLQALTPNCLTKAPQQPTVYISKHSIFTPYVFRSRKDSDERWLSIYTWALWTAGVLCAGGVLTKQWWTDFSLTQDTSTVACTLCARINIPCLSFYKVFPTRSMTDWWTGELWLLHNYFIWKNRSGRQAKSTVTLMINKCTQD